eukprot:365340-Chlamydomonas_euryale.AAC.9
MQAQGHAACSMHDGMHAAACSSPRCKSGSAYTDELRHACRLASRQAWQAAEQPPLPACVHMSMSACMDTCIHESVHARIFA